MIGTLQNKMIMKLTQKDDMPFEFFYLWVIRAQEDGLDYAGRLCFGWHVGK